MTVHYNIFQFEISVSKPHSMDVVRSLQNLRERAMDLRRSHHPSCNDLEESKGRILHDFVPASALLDQVQRLDNIPMMQHRTNREFSRDLPRVRLLRFHRVANPEFLDSDDDAILWIRQSLDSPVPSIADDLPEIPVLLLQVVGLREWNID